MQQKKIIETRARSSAAISDLTKKLQEAFEEGYRLPKTYKDIHVAPTMRMSGSVARIKVVLIKDIDINKTLTHKTLENIQPNEDIQNCMVGEPTILGEISGEGEKIVAESTELAEDIISGYLEMLEDMDKDGMKALIEEHQIEMPKSYKSPQAIRNYLTRHFQGLLKDVS